MRVRSPRTVDPLAFARALAEAGHVGVALLDARGRGGWPASFVACEPRAWSSSLDPHVAAPTSPELAEVPRWMGVLPYEGLRDLERPRWTPAETRPPPRCGAPRWARYGAVARFDPTGVEVLGDDEDAVEELASALRTIGPPTIAAPTFVLADADPPAAHEARIRRAIELIRAGDLYQVNLARRLDLVGSTTAASALAAYERFAARAEAPFGAFLDLGDGTLVLSTSPELLLDARAEGAGFGALATEPIKGTRPRGTGERDAELARELDRDPKERAELAMIVDVERNDLGRVARTGSVRIAQAPRVVTHATVHHREARIEATARPDATRLDVLRAMLPSGSVTGAPKVRAMEVIAELEAHRRGLYTGGIGYVTHGGHVRLAMAIRTLVLGPVGGAYGTGGGIVLGSDPAREVEETRWKAVQLQAVLG